MGKYEYETGFPVPEPVTDGEYHHEPVEPAEDFISKRVKDRLDAGVALSRIEILGVTIFIDGVPVDSF